MNVNTNSLQTVISYKTKKTKVMGVTYNIYVGVVYCSLYYIYITLCISMISLNYFT